MRKRLNPGTELPSLGFRTTAVSKTGRKIVATVGFRTAATFYNRSRGQKYSGQPDKLPIFWSFVRDGASGFRPNPRPGWLWQLIK
jgi:hypothetical protein